MEHTNTYTDVGTVTNVPMGATVIYSGIRRMVDSHWPGSSHILLQSHEMYTHSGNCAFLYAVQRVPVADVIFVSCEWVCIRCVMLGLLHLRKYAFPRKTCARCNKETLCRYIPVAWKESIL